MRAKQSCASALIPSWGASPLPWRNAQRHRVALRTILRPGYDVPDYRNQTSGHPRLREKPAEAGVWIVCETITIESAKTRVREYLAVDRQFERHASNTFALCNDRGARRSQAVQTVHRRSLVPRLQNHHPRRLHISCGELRARPYGTMLQQVGLCSVNGLVTTRQLYPATARLALRAPTFTAGDRKRLVVRSPASIGSANGRSRAAPGSNRATRRLATRKL